uniref:AsIV-cont00020-ORF1 n=1 Tax=Apophua simplicipes ichnovirus TaxID=1329648 RepID=S5DR35_9VIRU|nr:AsIV-cont00020-ORF1 [Apophua simplicipes ichnovirus]
MADSTVSLKMNYEIPNNATLQTQYQTVSDNTNFFLFDRVRGTSTPLSTDAFENLQNNIKNRRAAVPCWDHSRVILSKVDSTTGEDSTYDRANYVDGFSIGKKFIATQAPKAETVDNFLDMVWQNRCRYIVVLTKIIENNEEKCYPYWLTHIGYKKTEKYIVTTKKINEFEEHTKYILKLKNRKIAKEFCIITLYHYTDWPENGTPANVLQFAGLASSINMDYKDYRFYEKEAAGPIVVHGSAGAGRTGTYCAIDYCMDQYLQTKTVDVFTAVRRIRSMCHSSVMNVDQYKVIFCVLKEFIDFLAQYSE